MVGFDLVYVWYYFLVMCKVVLCLVVCWEKMVGMFVVL